MNWRQFPRVLRSEYLGFGPECGLFEKELAAFLGRRTIVVNSGTAALQLALQALGVGIGDRVLVPTITYVATFQAVSATGAVPIPCAVNDLMLLDETILERFFTRDVKCIVPVMYAGQSVGMDEIYRFAEHKGLPVVVDAAHAFGCDEVHRFSDTIPIVYCYSFDGIKNITSGEGGAIVSNDEVILNKVKDIRLLGVQKDSERRSNKERVGNLKSLNKAGAII